MDSEERTVEQAEVLLEFYDRLLSNYFPEVHKAIMSYPCYDVRTKSSDVLVGNKVDDFLNPEYSQETLDAHWEEMQLKLGERYNGHE